MGGLSDAQLFYNNLYLNMFEKKTFKMYMLPKVIIFKDWGSVSASASASELELLTKLIYVGLNATTVKCLT